MRPRVERMPFVARFRKDRGKRREANVRRSEDAVMKEALN